MNEHDLGCKLNWNPLVKLIAIQILDFKNLRKIVFFLSKMISELIQKHTYIKITIRNINKNFTPIAIRIVYDPKKIFKFCLKLANFGT